MPLKSAEQPPWEVISMRVTIVTSPLVITVAATDIVPSVKEKPRGLDKARKTLNFHLFTLPDSINALAIHNPKLVFGVLFEAVWQTLAQFGKSQDLQMGMIAILHTWDKIYPCIHTYIALFLVAVSISMAIGRIFAVW